MDPSGTSVNSRQTSKRADQITPSKRKPLWRRIHRPTKKEFWRSAGVIGVILVLLVGFLVAKGYLKLRNIFRGGAGTAAALQDGVDPSQLRGEGDGRVNILILGKGGPGHDGPDLTDTLLLLSIDPIQKEAGLLSIPRDLWTQTDNGSSYSKINAVYINAKDSALAQGKTKAQAESIGIKTAQRTVEKFLGIPMHYYVMVDFEAFRKAIDTVGGVSINVKAPLYDKTVAWENNWNPLIAGQGMQVFNGKRALLYVRSRHGTARGDFDRTERQRELLIALNKKVLSLGTFSNPLRISQLMDAFGNHVRTDLNIENSRRLYELGKEIDASKVKSISLADPPNELVESRTIAGLSVVVPTAGIGNYDAIHNYVRNKLKDGFIRKENANIVILNGSKSPGLATQKAKELKSYGYNVTKVDNAPDNNYQHTMLVDLRNGDKKYTRHYLQLRFKVNAVGDLPDKNIDPGWADFVIILGQDASAQQ